MPVSVSREKEKYKSMHAVTIVAKNYLSRAKGLAESYKKHNPLAPPLSILVVDANPGEIQSGNSYSIFTADDLPMTSKEFHQMAMIYNVTELCTAVKAWTLEMLIDKGAKVVIYLDPDIVVYDSLYALKEITEKNQIVLTPHCIEPIPDDGLLPTQQDIMKAGAYNLGFISVSPAAMPMIKWWKDRKKRDCIIDFENGLFVDQKWMDVIPSYFDNYILKDPGFNVAYWNLHERKVTELNNKFFVNNSPLIFFHFSGYND